MLIIIPVRKEDGRDYLTYLTTQILDCAGRAEEDDVLVLYDKDAAGEGLYVFQQLDRRGFKSVTEKMLPGSADTGPEHVANRLFVVASQMAAESKQNFWTFLESPSVPIQDGWSRKLDMDFPAEAMVMGDERIQAGRLLLPVGPLVLRKQFYGWSKLVHFMPGSVTWRQYLAMEIAKVWADSRFIGVKDDSETWLAHGKIAASPQNERKSMSYDHKEKLKENAAKARQARKAKLEQEKNQPELVTQ